jgi:ketosteroid isomerase-like protein
MSNYNETHAFLIGLYASYASGDIGPTMAAMADDIVFEYVGPADIFPFCGVRHGKAEMIAAIGAIAAAFDVVSIEVDRILVDEKGYVAILQASFRDKRTGAIMECELVDIAKTQGDKIIEVREYWDVESVTQQLMGMRLALAPI